MFLPVTQVKGYPHAKSLMSEKRRMAVDDLKHRMSEWENYGLCFPNLNIVYLEDKEIVALKDNSFLADAIVKPTDYEGYKITAKEAITYIDAKKRINEQLISYGLVPINVAFTENTYEAFTIMLNFYTVIANSNLSKNSFIGLPLSVNYTSDYYNSVYNDENTYEGYNFTNEETGPPEGEPVAEDDLAF